MHLCAWGGGRERSSYKILGFQDKFNRKGVSLKSPNYCILFTGGLVGKISQPQLSPNYFVDGFPSWEPWTQRLCVTKYRHLYKNMTEYR